MNETKIPLVLIVDDNLSNVQVLGGMLRPEGYRIGVAHNGQQALDQIKRIVPDLILLDVMMPGMDGFQVCEILKSDPRTQDIPIIFLTVKTKTEDIVRGLELGAVDYVSKPFYSPELIRRVKTHLELKQKSDFIKKVSNDRKQLIHVLCHDLVHPINAIVKYINLLPDNKYNDYMNMATTNCLNIIEIARTLSTFEEGNLNLDIEPLNLLRMIEDSRDILSHKFDKKGVTLVLSIDESINVLVEKTSFINSVISNILTNALKFSFPSHKISVTAETNNKTVFLTITDTGIGMPDVLCTMLFDVKKTTARQGTNGELGTGFGMPLVKKFIEAYGGTIKIISKDLDNHPDNHGTNVVLELIKA